MKHDTFDTNPKALNLVLKCGIQPNLDGCSQLSKAVELRAECKYSMPEITKMIAELSGITTGCLSRNMSYAIRTAYNVEEKLSKLVGIPIPKGSVHSAMLISHLAIKLNSMPKED